MRYCCDDDTYTKRFLIRAATWSCDDRTDTLQVVARTGADKLFPIVSAASVVAKAERDAAMAALSAECGHNLGSGSVSPG